MDMASLVRQGQSGVDCRLINMEGKRSAQDMMTAIVMKKENQLEEVQVDHQANFGKLRDKMFLGQVQIIMPFSPQILFRLLIYMELMSGASVNIIKWIFSAGTGFVSSLPKIVLYFLSTATRRFTLK